jgi:hypothetical protein
MYSRIALIETALEPLGTVGAQFLDNVNSFPSLAILRPMIAGKSGEQHQNVSSRRATVVRNAIGGRVTLDELLLTIRGYTYSSMETSLDETEALAREIERTIQTLRSPLIYSAKVLTLHTDEGLYAPYGICDVQCSIEWINEQ